MYFGAQYTNGLTDKPIGIRVKINGVASFVPLGSSNTDYQNIMALVAAGELVIAPAETANE